MQRNRKVWSVLNLIAQVVGWITIIFWLIPSLVLYAAIFFYVVAFLGLSSGIYFFAFRGRKIRYWKVELETEKNGVRRKRIREGGISHRGKIIEGEFERTS